MSGYPCMPRRHLRAHTVRQVQHRVAKHGAVNFQLTPTSAHVHTSDDRSCQTSGVRNTYGPYIIPTRYCLLNEEGARAKA